MADIMWDPTPTTKAAEETGVKKSFKALAKGAKRPHTGGMPSTTITDDDETGVMPSFFPTVDETGGMPSTTITDDEIGGMPSTTIADDDRQGPRHHGGISFSDGSHSMGQDIMKHQSHMRPHTRRGSNVTIESDMFNYFLLWLYVRAHPTGPRHPYCLCSHAILARPWFLPSHLPPSADHSSASIIDHLRCLLL